MYMWQLRFNNKMQSSLDRLNLGPGLAKNKTKGNEDKREKKPTKREKKAIKLVLKDIEWPDQLSMKRIGTCKSAYL